MVILFFHKTLLGCGLAYYLYNEMGFRVLNRLDPVSAAVGNTVKSVIDVGEVDFVTLVDVGVGLYWCQVVLVVVDGCRRWSLMVAGRCCLVDFYFCIRLFFVFLLCTCSYCVFPCRLVLRVNCSYVFSRCSRILSCVFS